jgi:hypothetical protein
MSEDGDKFVKIRIEEIAYHVFYVNKAFASNLMLEIELRILVYHKSNATIVLARVRLPRHV